MMGRQPKVQNKLFYTTFNLEQRVRQDHILRKVKSCIDSSIMQVDAFNNSVIKKDCLKRYLNKSYQILESRLEKEKSSVSKSGHNNLPAQNPGIPSSPEIAAIFLLQTSSNS